MWYVGVDWADQHHDVVVIDEQGKQIGAKRIVHTAAGLDELVSFLRAVGDVAEHPDHLACILETNKGLLITALLEAGFPVYSVNPKTLQGWRKPSGAKTDQIDAWLLARKGRSDLDQMCRLEPDNPIIAELKQLTRDQDSLIHMQTRLVNQLHACLKAYRPTGGDIRQRERVKIPAFRSLATVGHQVGFHEIGAQIVPVFEGTHRHLVLEQGSPPGRLDAVWLVYAPQRMQEPVGGGRTDAKQVRPSRLIEGQVPMAFEGSHQLRQKGDEPLGTDIVCRGPRYGERLLHLLAVVPWPRSSNRLDRRRSAE
jgi:transposase